ncbi:hypothetical protein MCEMSE15_02022 [Fimbriimonadaceae bacterium]
MTALAVIACMTQGQSDVPEVPIAICTLAKAVKTILVGENLKLTFGTGLENAPVVLRQVHQTTPRKDLTSLCQVLKLDCQIDDAAGKLTIKRGPNLKPTNLGPEIQKMLAEYRDWWRTYQNASPEQLFTEAERLSKLIEAQPRSADGRGMSKQRDFLRKLCAPSGRLIATSLFHPTAQSTAVLSQPTGPRNQIPIPGPALGYLKKVLAGNAIAPADSTSSPNENSTKWMEYRLFHAEQSKELVDAGSSAPLVELRHSATESGFVVFLHLITPKNIVVADAISFGSSSQPETPRLPDELNRLKIEPAPVWSPIWRTVNSLWPVAKLKGLNFAAWFSDRTISSYPGQTLEQQRQLAPLELIESGGWLSINDVSKPSAIEPPGWPIFFKLREQFEIDKGRPDKMKTELDLLSPKQLSDLEALANSAELPDRYHAVTSHIRLFRAIARSPVEYGSAETMIPFEDLPLSARNDVRDFLASPYVWRYYASLRHPKNRGAIQKSYLKIQPGPKDKFAFSVEFPRDNNPIARQSLLGFTIPKGWVEYELGADRN